MPFREEDRRIVALAIEEDLAGGDVTTEALVPPSLRGRAYFLAKAEGVVAGLEVAELAFQQVNASVTLNVLKPDGSRVKPGDRLATVEAPVATILKAERTALNFLQRLSGVATMTSRYVEAVQGANAKVLGTRKTTPGMRAFEKYAVRVGGGQNHRMSLSDGILIKDNHLVAAGKQRVTIAEAVRKAREQAKGRLKVEVEVTSLDQAKEALAAGADILLLDNMPVPVMREAVSLARGRALTEASGGITLENVRQVAETGVDYISIGALTHSVRALDISLELE